MLYALIGTGLVGALAVAFLLWRRSVLETALAKSQASEKNALEASQRALDELKNRTEAFENQLGRQRDQIETLRIQRDKAITALANTGNPGDIADLLRDQLSKIGNT